MFLNFLILMKLPDGDFFKKLLLLTELKMIGSVTLLDFPLII